MCAAVIGHSQLRTKTKVEPFGLSLWSQRKTDPKSETSSVYACCKGSVSLCMMSEYHDGICWRGPTTAPVLSQMVQHGLLWHAWLERLTVQTGGYALHQPIASPAGNGEPAYTCYPCLHIFNHTSLSLPTIQLERGRVQHTWA